MSIESRLEDFVRSLLGEEDRPIGSPRHSGARQDPDYAAALTDLEYYLRTGVDRAATATRNSRKPPSSPGRSTAGLSMPRTVRRAFSALEVTPGSDFTVVTRSYKRLLAQFHPDKHASGTERTEAATEVTKRLNLAYRVIRDYYLVTGKLEP